MATKKEPVLIVSVPVPTGPEATPIPSVGALLEFSMRPEALTVSPPVKVLCPLNSRTPPPISVKLAPVPTILAVTLMEGDKPLNGVSAFSPMAPMFNVFAVAPKSSVPLMVGRVATLLEVTVMGVGEDKARVPPVLTNGVASPPSLLKFSAKSVLFPTSVRAELPLRVTVFVPAICPALPTMITLPEFKVRPPVGITTAEAKPFKDSVPWLTTVPLV